ncbi:transcription factor IIIA-like [Aristolochia californica]|uniref:transcription factor IIIA-like n=1 Tax=Aristolochia californica TaxID=171875 RepID=UPI0035E0D713
MGEEREGTGKDIRRYYCEFCGIGRSKKSLINAHVLAHHKEEAQDHQMSEDDGVAGHRSCFACEECGATFRKPAYLKQHMQGHSLERPFACTVDDCHKNYRRKDHLTRHMLRHEGKLFVCPIENCSRRFAFQGNMTRHVNELHDGEPMERQKQHICQEIGCGKVFKFASRLKKHADSHVKLDFTEAICSEPNCMEYFSNAECLRAHVQSCHRYVECDVCDARQLKKNLKRHLQSHEGKVPSATERIRCSYSGCCYTFSTVSNLNQHVKAVHLALRPFTCRFSGCGKRFPYKHVRDNHEKSGAHVYIPGDFVESDEQFRSRQRGGRKRKPLTVEALQRKRVVPPGQSSVLDNGSEYLSWLLASED